jgi:phage baseplate assembly protein gpV
MFGMPSSPQDPVASYDVVGDRLFRNQRPGTRGYVASPDLLTTGVIGNNNSLVLQSKWVRPKVGSITVQFGILGPNAPLALFENGIPATLKLTPNQGYQLAATFPGLRGNQMSLTVNLPSPYPKSGVTTPLVIKAVPPGQIVVTLATTGIGQNTIPTVTTTATLLVAALNANPGINRWVTAWVSDSTLVAPLTPLPLTRFAGGMDIPYLEYVSVNANTAGVVATTATQVLNLLKASDFVGATNNGASTGAGAVTVLGPLALTGGRLSGGAILDEDATKLKDYLFDITFGQGIRHLTNRGLQVFQSRHGANRTWKVVPTQDRVIVADMRNTVGGVQTVGVNHSMEHAPRSLFL